MIKIRVDDFPYTKREERDRHNLLAFRDFKKVLEKHNVGYWLLGVIPGNCSPEDLDYLRHQCPYTRVGMHGIFHDESRPNEFLPYATSKEIERQLSVTRTLLEAALNRDVRVYMPPHNVIDWRTIEALRPAGFRAFTGGPETPNELRVSHEHLQYIHSEPPHEYGRSDELLQRNSAAHLLRWSGKDDVWLTLHWTWEVNIGLKNLDLFLAEISDSISPSNYRF